MKNYQEMEILLHPQRSAPQGSGVLAGIKTKGSPSCIKPQRRGSCRVTPGRPCSPCPAPAAITAPASSSLPSLAFQALSLSLQSHLPKKWQHCRTFILSLERIHPLAALLNYTRCPSQGQVSPKGVETPGAASPPGTSRTTHRTYRV